MKIAMLIVSIIVLIFAISFFRTSLKCYLPIRLERQKQLMHKRLDHDFFFPITVIVDSDDYPFSYINNVLTQDYRLFEVIMTDSTGNKEKLDRLIKHYALKEDDNRPIRYYKDCTHPDKIYKGREGNIPLTLLVLNPENIPDNSSNMPLLDASISASKMPYISFSKTESKKIIPGTCLRNMARSVLEDDNITEVSLYGMILYNKVKYMEGPQTATVNAP